MLKKMQENRKFSPLTGLSEESFRKTHIPGLISFRYLCGSEWVGDSGELLQLAIKKRQHLHTGSVTPLVPL